MDKTLIVFLSFISGVFFRSFLSPHNPTEDNFLIISFIVIPALILAWDKWLENRKSKTQRQLLERERGMFPERFLGGHNQISKK